MPRVKKAHVIVEYGKPIYPNELDKEPMRHAKTPSAETLGVFKIDYFMF